MNKTPNDDLKTSLLAVFAISAAFAITTSNGFAGFLATVSGVSLGAILLYETYGPRRKG